MGEMKIETINYITKTIESMEMPEDVTWHTSRVLSGETIMYEFISLGHYWIYRLTVANVDGELMMETLGGRVPLNERNLYFDMAANSVRKQGKRRGSDGDYERQKYHAERDREYLDSCGTKGGKYEGKR